MHTTALCTCCHLQSTAASGDGARGRRRESGRRRALDGELLRLSEDGVQVVGVLDEVDLEAGAGLPATAGRVHGNLAEGSDNERVEDLAGRGEAGLETRRKAGATTLL